MRSENGKKSFLIFLELSPFADLDFMISLKKTITARGFKLGQLIEGDK